MSQDASNGRGPNTIAEPEQDQAPAAVPKPEGDDSKSNGNPSAGFARRDKKQGPQDNKRLLVITAGLGFALVMFILAVTSAQKSMSTSGHKKTANQTIKIGQTGSTSEPSTTPITDSTRSSAESTPEGFATADDIARTATSSPKTESPTSSAKAGDTLGSVPPFTAGENWQPPEFQPGAQGSENDDSPSSRSERDAMEKASLVFVRTVSGKSTEGKEDFAAEPEVALPPGTRLRARLESAASTATQAPVIAVVEYNYEQNGEIVVPAGAKAFGRLEQADRLGYVAVRFDSLMMPDGSISRIEGVATDLAMRPLKGKVEGSNSGKNLLVRSFSGLGQAAAMLVGHGSLNQPLSEQDLLRERLSNNIGQASDEELMNMAVRERIVVSVPASTPIYVILQRPSKRPMPVPDERGAYNHGESSIRQPASDQLKELLQLQRELNDQTTVKTPSP